MDKPVKTSNLSGFIVERRKHDRGYDYEVDLGKDSHRLVFYSTKKIGQGNNVCVKATGKNIMEATEFVLEFSNRGKKSTLKLSRGARTYPYPKKHH